MDSYYNAALGSLILLNTGHDKYGKPGEIELTKDIFLIWLSWGTFCVSAVSIFGENWVFMVTPLPGK